MLDQRTFKNVKMESLQCLLARRCEVNKKIFADTILWGDAAMELDEIDRKIGRCEDCDCDTVVSSVVMCSDAHSVCSDAHSVHSDAHSVEGVVSKQKKNKYFIVCKDLYLGVTDKALREVFDTVPGATVTSVVIPLNGVGRTRGFAFIGFSDKMGRDAAVEWGGQIGMNCIVGDGGGVLEKVQIWEGGVVEGVARGCGKVVAKGGWCCGWL